MIARFSVPGEPKPKERPRINLQRGTVYTPKPTREYEEAIAWQAKATGVRFGTKTVSVSARFYLSKRMKDGDNLLKSALDGLQKSGMIENDSQVLHGEFYLLQDRENPRTVLTITGLEPLTCGYCGFTGVSVHEYNANSGGNVRIAACTEHADLVDSERFLS